MDYFDNLSHDWFGYTEIKIKDIGLNIFLNKKILIYGLGKSGLSTFNFLKKKADIYLYDDFQTKIKNPDIKKNSLEIKTFLILILTK